MSRSIILKGKTGREMHLNVTPLDHIVNRIIPEEERLRRS